MSPIERTLVWSGPEDWQGGWHAEIARLELGGDAMRAAGTQLGVDPLPYRLDYELDATGDDFVTRRLAVNVAGEGWSRRLRLKRGDDGEWAIDASGDGESGLPAPGGDAAALAGALDCDLGFSPSTNTMPVLRHGLHRGPGEATLLMAWVSVPDLAVHASPQRYEHLRRIDDGGAIVRYQSLEGDRAVFSSDLELDADGLVRLYPKLARRVG